MKIAALTQGQSVPSARFRIRQLIAPLQAAGIQIDELVGRPGAYPPAGTSARLGWAAGALGDAARRVWRSRRYDTSIVQRELISTLPSLESWAGRPMVADIDDAIWLNRGGHAASHLAKAADHIVVGNDYLAEHFARYGKPVSIIATAVDVQRFRPVPRKAGTPPVIGWSGTWGGYAYFEPLQDALAALLRRHPDWRLRFVSDRPPTLERLPPAQVEYRPWSPDTEAALTADMDIGLMPLDDTLWSLGKCSYKMLLYMACGVPVVATELGMNRDVLAMREVGLGVRSQQDWVDALERLIGDDALRQRMGRQGRDLVVERFSLETIAQQWRQVLATLPTR